MKHGVKYRSLSRPTAHRMLMLRNMVTSLFQHEQIETTLPKAREAARLAEKMITLSKRNNKHSYDKAGRFLLDKAMLPKLFTTFAQRYADRPGGYTRIHKYMNNPADNAPRAILELVDNPKDLRWALTSRAVGWEFLKHKLQSDTRENILQETPNSAQELVRSERTIDQFDKGGLLRPKTRWNLQKVLRYRDDSAALRLGNQANGYINKLLHPQRADLTDGSKLDPGRASLSDTLNVEDLSKGRLGNAGRPPREAKVRRPVR